MVSSLTVLQNGTISFPHRNQVCAPLLTTPATDQKNQFGDDFLKTSGPASVNEKNNSVFVPHSVSDLILGLGLDEMTCDILPVVLKKLSIKISLESLKSPQEV